MADKEDQSDESAPRVARDKLTTMLMMAAGLVAISGFAALFSVWWRSGITDSHEILRLASQEFISGRPVVAGELAETVTFAEEDQEEIPEESLDPAADPSEPESDEEQPTNELGVDDWIRLRDFLVGAGKVAKTLHEEDAQQRRQLLLDAIEPLESARKGGFPPGRETEGQRILGESLFKLGRFDAATEPLVEAVRRDPTLRRDLLPMIAESQLRAKNPMSEQAVRTIESHLQDSSLQPKQRWDSELIRVRALTESKRYREAKSLIGQLLQNPKNSIDSYEDAEADFRDELNLRAAVLPIRQAMEKTASVDDFRTELADSIVALGRLQRESSPLIASQARLWAARAQSVLGDLEPALIGLTAVRQQRHFGPVSIVGGLEEIELLARQGRGLEVLHTTRYMVREIGDESGFDSSMITFDDFRSRMSKAIGDLRAADDFKNAIDVARSLPPVFGLSEALEQEAIGYSQWADMTLDDGTDATGEVARSASILARSRYRAAGDAYEHAAKLRFDSEEFLPLQWAAIVAYQKGRHFRRSTELLAPYLRYEERRRQPRGLVAYGRALLAEGDEELAIKSLKTCIVEYPRDPLSYDARLLIAQAHAEQKNLEQAREYLTENLRDGELTPQSPAWRDSLYSLGEMLYEQGYQNHLASEQVGDDERKQMLKENQPILEDAIRYLDESVERYWPMQRAVEAAYRSSRARVLASEWSRLESQSPELLDAARRSMRAQADQQLQVALDGFVNLRNHLQTREEDFRLATKEEAVLRNCFMAEAEVLLEMSRLDEAATAYRTVELRYMNEPAALEAILGRAKCARALGRDREANGLIRQASIVLGRIPNEWNEKFDQTTRFDRAGWERYLTWMTRRISDGGV